MNLKNSENIFVLGIFLGITGIISALVLALFTQVVAKPIEEARLRGVNNALKQILPEFDNQPSENTIEVLSPSGMKVTFMGAKKDGKLVAVAGEGSEGSGYGGAITGLVGLELDGKIRSVLITGHNETPGLGDKVCVRKREKTIFNMFDEVPEGLAPNAILDQFADQTAPKDKNWDLTKEGGTINFVAGATVTSRAVNILVSEINRAYILNKNEIDTKLGGKK